MSELPPEYKLPIESDVNEKLTAYVSLSMAKLAINLEEV